MIELINVKKQFDNSDNYITNGVYLFVPAGKSIAIIGLSGEGKSVLLKQIIGLIPVSSGSILIDGIDVTKLSSVELSFIYKKCGYVFQFAALLDSLTIKENLLLVIEDNNYTDQEADDIIHNALEKVNLVSTIKNRYPSEISGGMRKRVGLARTLLSNPEIILYDEPTSGLDPINTTIIHELMRQKQIEKNITSIVVSHDIEIFKYVDLVGILYQGKIEYICSADKIWECEDPFVYQFIRGNIKGPII